MDSKKIELRVCDKHLKELQDSWGVLMDVDFQVDKFPDPDSCNLCFNELLSEKYPERVTELKQVVASRDEKRLRQIYFETQRLSNLLDDTKLPRAKWLVTPRTSGA